MISSSVRQKQRRSFEPASNEIVPFRTRTDMAWERLRAYLPAIPRKISDSQVTLLGKRTQAFDRLDPNGTQVCAVIKVLQYAWDCARENDRQTWDFAVEISEFTNSGISKQILRHLVCLGWVVHQRETSELDQESRSFRPEPFVSFSDQSCFILTPLGLSQIRNRTQNNIMQSFNGEAESKTPDKIKIMINGTEHSPIWDTVRRELRLGEIVIKRFKWPAENQTSILDAFENLGWPKKISDPLPEDSKVCPKRRLHDAIKCLNRKQLHKLIKFRGDGTGNGVVMEITVD